MKALETAVIQNPVLRGFNPDPCIIRVEEDYYIVTSTFEWYPGIPVYHSRDLVHWQHVSSILTDHIQLEGNPDSGSIWAPALSWNEGLFYIVYTDVKRSKYPFKDAHNYVRTAESITGPWSPPLFLNSGGFDPSLFHDEDGRKWFLYVNWDHRIDGRNKSAGISMREYSEKKQKLTGPVYPVFSGTSLRKTEAPHVYKRNGWYYLLTAEGGTGKTHAVTVARSRRITGPYEVDPANPMMTSAHDESLLLQKAGHASLVETQNGDWFIAHLCSRPVKGAHSILGRETALQRVKWEHDWLRLASGGIEAEVEVRAPDLPPHPFPADENEWDDFKGSLLHRTWSTVRIAPDESWCTLTERPGYMRIKGGESLHSLHRQHLIARRQQHLQCEVETAVEFDPDSFLQMAGLVLYYNTDNYVYVFVSRDEEKGKCLGMMQCIKGEFKALDICIPVAQAETKLKAVLQGDRASFHYRDGSGEWLPVASSVSTAHLSDEGNGFTGNFVGMCVQDMQGTHRAADFDYFSYKELEQK